MPFQNTDYIIVKEDQNTIQPTQKFLDKVNLPKIDTPLHKALGNGGFSTEYYKMFLTILAPHLTKMFNAAVAIKKFPKELLESLIITIPKPGKDPTSTSSYRPISLLHLDLKMYAKILANRLLEITPYLIDPDLVGFLKGQQAHDSLGRMINHSIHFRHKC